MISYEPLWNTMKNRNITTYTLISKEGFSPQIINNLRHNKSITMHTLQKLCNIMGCTPNDVVAFIDDTE